MKSTSIKIISIIAFTLATCVLIVYFMGFYYVYNGFPLKKANVSFNFTDFSECIKDCAKVFEISNVVDKSTVIKNPISLQITNGKSSFVFGMVAALSDTIIIYKNDSLIILDNNESNRSLVDDRNGPISEFYHILDKNAKATFDFELY